MADGLLTVVAQPNVLTPERVFCHAVAGQTVAKLLGDAVSHSCEVTVGGYPVPRELWSKVRPKAGQTLHAVIYPQGGNGGKWARLVLTVVLMYFTYGQSGWAASASAAFGGSAAAWGAAIMLVGQLAINALVPPPTQKGLGGSGDPFNQLASLTGTSNQANPYGVIPCVVGTLPDYFPPHAALPYTEISGDDQYMRMLLDIGEGDDLDVSDIVIGETPIDSFDDVEYEVTRTPTLFTQDIFELAVGTTLAEGANDTRTSQDGATELSVDLIYPSGLFAVNDKGDFVKVVNHVDILFRQVGTTTWYGLQSPTPGVTASSPAIHLESPTTSAWLVTSSANKALRVGVRWKVSPGQYEVKVNNLGYDWDASVQQSLTMVWSVLRSISPQLPSTTNTTKLAVRIKATDQLQGVVQNLKCKVAQRIPVYDSGTGTWSDPVETQNPAHIYAWLMTRCPAVMRRLTDDRLDLDGIATWASECDAKGLKVSFAIDSARALGDILRDVLAAGRASFGLRNGKYSAVRDIPQTVPVQMFTPANSWGFSYSRSFADLPQALRVSFTNPEANSQQDTIVVYWDGYSADGAGGTQIATRFETLDLRMVVDPAAAWRLGRYHLAVIWNRPTQYSFQADIEHMVCERGDLIHVAHDLIGWGVAWGRVKAVTGSRVVLDGALDLDPTKSYAIRVRRDGNDQVQGAASPLITWDSALVTFDNDTLLDEINGPTAMLASSLDVQPGDLYVVGEVNKVVAQLIVRSIEPGEDLTATLTCVDAAPAVWTADNGTPPTFVSEITGKAWCAPPDPPTLNIRVGTTAPNNGGLNDNEGGFSGPHNPGIYRLEYYRRRAQEAANR